jgi:hypothetical protein
MQIKKKGSREIADKRVAITQSTWVALQDLRVPWKSLGDTIVDLVAEPSTG